jgi:hypothetical protein
MLKMENFSSLTPYTISLGFLIDKQKYMEGVNSHVSMQSSSCFGSKLFTLQFSTFNCLMHLKINSLRMIVLSKRNEFAGNDLGNFLIKNVIKSEFFTTSWTLLYQEPHHVFK